MSLPVREGPVEISSDFTIDSWQECDLMERATGESHEESHLRIDITPYEIKTLFTCNGQIIALEIILQLEC